MGNVVPVFPEAQDGFWLIQTVGDAPEENKGAAGPPAEHSQDHAWDKVAHSCGQGRSADLLPKKVCQEEAKEEDVESDVEAVPEG